MRLSGNSQNKEKAVLLGLCLRASSGTEEECERSLLELAELCESCGLEVLASATQKREAPDAAYFAGKGKIEELSAWAKEIGADCLILDDELSGSQMRNISELSDMKILDRTLLILDIFARRASSSEGVLQVEIAQLEDRLSRLTGSGKALSRLGGGIGTRGPGESKLESDRRHVRRRINQLKRELKALEARRGQHRERRQERQAQSFAVCGYTNAGKSSLVNLLCDSELDACDQLFATLDPSARRLKGSGPEILLLDTVGFIRKLPHQLVEAFRSTLDEVREADFILQVTDLSDPNCERQVELVEEMLNDLGAAAKPRIHVLNKADLCPEIPVGRRIYRSRQEREIPEFIVSVRENRGMDMLLKEMRKMVEEGLPLRKIFLPYDESRGRGYLHQHAFIEKEYCLEEGYEIHYRLPWSRTQAFDVLVGERK